MFLPIVMHFTAHLSCVSIMFIMLQAADK